MLHVSQNYKSGTVALETVDPPALRRGGVLVRSAYSVISAGTEGMKVREGKMNYLQKARARPDHVKKVLQTVQQQGISATYQKVMNKLDSLTPLGYSLSGTVEAVGADANEFSVGQRVACAGAGYANHAEINFVPKNLVVPIPDGVSMDQAAFTTIGAIALHGFRQGDMRLGETACVIGLGLVGQVLIQILKAAGMIVVGIDISEERCRLAEQCGASIAGEPDDERVVQALGRLSAGAGADCAFLVASSSSNGPLEKAMAMVRDRGRIVVVGKTKADLPFVEFFEKEIDVRFSRSYGPGRYDPRYEEDGIDYPIGYVRWTEKRNLAAFLDLMDKKLIDLGPIISAVYPFADATDVYEKMNAGELHGLGTLFRYDNAELDRTPPATHPARQAKPAGQAVRIGVVGAGNYASSMLLPHLQRDDKIDLVAVATATALSGGNAGRKFGFARHSTDYKGLLSADDIDAVLIATRHASHAAMTSEALRAGKTVFVEKPLAIDEDGLAQVITAVEETGNDRLMVGFNRRFAPIIVKTAKTFQGRGPLVMTYRVHAGQLDTGAWMTNPSEGSRFVGEAGHFFDTFAFLTGSRPVSVSAVALNPGAVCQDDRENVAVLVNYADGSVGNLLYLTQGSPKVPKEFLEVFGGGHTARMDNFESLTLFQGTQRARSRFSGKGQKEEMAAFVAACQTGSPMPISFDCLVETTRVTLAAAESLRTKQLIGLS